MKSPKKLIALSLTSALIASSMVVSSSAIFITRGTSCDGSNISWNSGYASPETQSSGCPSGSDVNSILNGLCPFGQAPSNRTSDYSDAAGASSNCTLPDQTIQSYLDAAKQNAGCSTANTADNRTDAASAKTSAAPEASPPANSNGGAATAAAAEETAAAPEASAGSSGNTCTTPADCSTGSCVASGQQCATAFNFSPTAENKFIECLNSIFAKCGIDLSKFGICLPGCSGTPAAEPSAPASGTDTSAAPSAGNPETTPPADQSGTGAAENGSVDNLSFEAQVVALVNEQRAANGLAPLTLNDQLSNAARAKSQDMHDNSYFSHTSPTYGSPFDMLHSFGISYMAAGENIAMGYATPEAVMTGWMNSPGHRANILNASYTQIGVGYVADGNYWTQEFIG